MSDAEQQQKQQEPAPAAQPEPQAPDASDAEEEQHAPAHDITATTVSGSRVRRSTQKFTVAEPKADDTDDFQPPAGKGQKIKDIALVNDVVAALNKKQAEILKALYLVMYARRFQLKNLKVIKEHILEFSGIPEQDPKSREVLFAKIAKWKRNFIQEVMDVLGVDRSKKSFDDEEKPFDKDAIVNRLIDWLYNPQEKKGGRKPTTPKTAAAKKTKKAEKTPAKKRKSTAKDTTAKKKQKTTASTKKTKAIAAAEEDDDEQEDDEEEDAHSGDESGSDYDESEKKKPAKKKKAAPTTKVKHVPRKPKSSKPIEDDDEEEDDDSNDAEEVDAKDDKSGAAKSSSNSGVALDADVKAKVKQIIEQGNAEELTVKKIVRQLSEELGRDLSGEKNAIKEFIKAGQ